MSVNINIFWGNGQECCPTPAITNYKNEVDKIYQMLAPYDAESECIAKVDLQTYFNANWGNCRNMWVRYLCNQTPSPEHNTNNRVQSTMPKLKVCYCTLMNFMLRWEDYQCCTLSRSQKEYMSMFLLQLRYDTHMQASQFFGNHMPHTGHWLAMEIICTGMSIVSRISYLWSNSNPDVRHTERIWNSSGKNHLLCDRQWE